MLNVERCDVVGHEENLVAPEFVSVFRFKLRLGDVAHQANDEVAGADEGIDDMHAFIGEGTAEPGLQHMRNAVHHEIDDGLRRVDDAVRIGLLDREALKKLFVDGVKKVLFLREVDERRRLPFDFAVKRIQPAEKFAAAVCGVEGCFQHVLNFACDDIPRGEIGILKDGAKYPFCQEMLDEHFLHGGFGEIGINGGLTELVKGGEIGAKLRVRAVLRFDEFGGFGADFGDDVLEACDSGVPLGGMGAFVSEKCLEDGDEGVAFGDVRV